MEAELKALRGLGWGEGDGGGGGGGGGSSRREEALAALGALVVVGCCPVCVCVLCGLARPTLRETSGCRLTGGLTDTYNSAVFPSSRPGPRPEPAAARGAAS